MTHADSTPKRGRADTVEARMQRAREEGYARGASEARLFKLAVGKDFKQQQALDWIGTATRRGPRRSGGPACTGKRN